MTWQAYVEVVDVDHDIAIANAVAGAMVRPWKGTDNGSDIEAPTLYSNTEGDIRSIEIEFEFAGPAPLNVGDLLYVGGHFNAKSAVAP